MSGAPRGMRVALAGATGALGSEILEVLEERRFPVDELVPLASPRSAGQEIEFRGEMLPVGIETPDLRGIDLLFLCTPPHAALDLAPRAARADLALFDLSGALAERADAQLLVAGVHAPRDALEAALVVPAPGDALAWIRVLDPLKRELGLRRVVGTGFVSAAGGGREGIEALSAESVALFNQKDLPEPSVFGRAVAFDCVPWVGALEPDGATDQEARLARAVRGVLGEKVGVAATAVRVPTFCGDGVALAVETERAAEPEAVAELLAAADGVTLWRDDPGPTTRATAGTDQVWVGRVRRDPSREGGVLLWLAADPLRLAASNAVRLAESRFRAH